jgi:hypothetical protein
MKWHHTTTPRKKGIKSVLSIGKITASVFRDEKGVIFFLIPCLGDINKPGPQ